MEESPQGASARDRINHRKKKKKRYRENQVRVTQWKKLEEANPSSNNDHEFPQVTQLVNGKDRTLAQVI